MSYAYVHDVPATWDTYSDIVEALSPDRPEGLLVHAAGPTDEGFRMIGIWESREMCNRFRDECLGKIVQSLTCGTRTRPTYRELRIEHLITGEPLARAHGRREGTRSFGVGRTAPLIPNSLATRPVRPDDVLPKPRSGGS